MPLIPAQVYIATTKSLVQVQTITALNDDQLSSVVTINKSVQSAGISMHYQAFVEKQLGIIQSTFGGNSYRMNISSQIDIGNSWQLGAYIAHCLHANNTLVESDAQCVFIASGEINTLDKSVMTVSELTQKCLVAHSAIKQWQSEGKHVYFLVPSDNFRQPLPDVSINLTPVASLAQLHTLLNNLGIIATHNKPLLESEIDELVLNDDISVLDEINDSVGAKEEALIIEALPLPWYRDIGMGMLVTLGGLVVATLLLLIFLFSKPTPVNLNYTIQADISQNRAACQYSDTQVISQGNFSALTLVPASSLRHLCDIRLLTSYDITAVWQVNGQGDVVPLLKSILTKDDALVWQFSNITDLDTSLHSSTKQLEQGQGKYFLLVFTQMVDDADHQSLSQFLQALQSSDAATSSHEAILKPTQYSLTDLANWARKLHIEVYFIAHEFKP